MASGLAVVAYNYAAAEDLIRNTVNGVIVPYDDAAAFIAAARTLANDPQQVQQLGQAARHTARQMNWDAIHERFEQALYAIVEKETDDDTAQLALARNR
ncbi:MAG: glycosyltransferase, partial [Pseudomonadota bacterium]